MTTRGGTETHARVNDGIPAFDRLARQRKIL